MKPAFITRLSISLFGLIAMGASMSMGVFGAAGLCAYIWGPSILDTVLGESPDRSHPAFITFLLVMVPGIVIGAVGGVAGVLVPLFSPRYPLHGCTLVLFAWVRDKYACFRPPNLEHH
ncbi:hypothetical protein [Roseimicrobium sp. ORNL1]|uniref:hypothetical protein n=1 Tax=Roseimicrobium sp. ORNL1 TaxID=2711231 RepID=UPI0013E16A62|nr:hypothetical protein [Roseimicrobium sp. ORNL1]QIF03032.1 hypothetical protein G5S37_16385 [Roseimicrobium sp. ORNL1]